MRSCARARRPQVRAVHEQRERDEVAVRRAAEARQRADAGQRPGLRPAAPRRARAAHALVQCPGPARERERAIEGLEPVLASDVQEQATHATRADRVRPREARSVHDPGGEAGLARELPRDARALARRAALPGPRAEPLQQRLGVVVVRHLVRVAHDALQRWRLPRRDRLRLRGRATGACVPRHVHLRAAQEDPQPPGGECRRLVCHPRPNGTTVPRLNDSADRGPTHREIPNPLAGPPRRPSKKVSSPNTRPETWSRPVSATDPRGSTSAFVPNVGSPAPFRYRSPSSSPSAIAPRASTSVAKRASEPRRSIVAAVVTSFCTDAGILRLEAFQSKTARPLPPSCTQAPEPAARGAHLPAERRAERGRGLDRGHRRGRDQRQDREQRERESSVATHPRWIAATAACVRFAAPVRSSTFETCARDGALGDPETRRDLGVVEAIDDQLQHLTLAGCERRAAGDPDAAHGAPYSNGQLREGAVLGQQGPGAQVRRRERVLRLRPLGEHDHRHAGGGHGTQLGGQRRLQDGDMRAARHARPGPGLVRLPDPCAAAREQRGDRAHVQAVAPAYEQAEACQTGVGFVADGGE